ncbi:MAG: response regulator [bacterium]|jgi:DNA-binding response OmpR family regulator
MNATPAARRIVVIEDDVDMAAMISKMLGRHGHEVIIAADGVEAIPKVMAGDVHMIILDIMMPFFSGYWYCDVFKKNPSTRDIPVLIISALDRESDIEKGLKLGADAYMTKPFTEEKLVATIDSIFAQRGKK